MAPELWREDLTSAWYGRSYTLVYPHPKTSSWRTDAINLHVNTSDGLTRRIFIHDPNYFLTSSNPMSLPINMYTLGPLQGRYYFSIALTKHVGLNTPHNPCIEDDNYSFLACMKESLSDKFGCRLEWDKLSSQARPVCGRLEQYQPFVAEYELLGDATLRQIFQRTGCNRPCNYRDYVVVNGPLKSALPTESFFSIELWMLTTDVTTQTDQLIYPESSLVTILEQILHL